VGEIVVVPDSVVNQLDDMDVLLFTDGSQEIDVLIVIVSGLVTSERVRNGVRGRAGEMCEIVVMPRPVIKQLVDMLIGSDEIDMVLVVAGGRRITSQRACPITTLHLHHRAGGWSAGQVGEIVMVPGPVVVELIDMKIVSDKDDVLLVVAVGNVAVGTTANDVKGFWSAREVGEIVVMPVTVVNQLVDMVVVSEEDSVLLVVERSHIAFDTAPLRGVWSAGKLGKVVNMPGAAVNQLVNMEVATQENNMLLEIVEALVTVDGTLQRGKNHRSSP
jgi:hypothetical protein